MTVYLHYQIETKQRRKKGISAVLDFVFFFDIVR